MNTLKRISSCEREGSFGHHEKTFAVTQCVYVTFETGYQCSERDARLTAKL